MHSHPKEREILELNARGLRSYEIARQLDLSVSDVTSVIWYAMPAPVQPKQLMRVKPIQKPERAPKCEMNNVEVKRLELDLKESNAKIDKLNLKLQRLDQRLKQSKAINAKFERRLSASNEMIERLDADNAALMLRLSKIAKKLGCKLNETEEAVSVLVQDLKRRKAIDAKLERAAARAAEKTPVVKACEWSNWMTRNDAAHCLGVTVRTITNYIKRGCRPNGLRFECRRASRQDASGAHYMVRCELADDAAQFKSREAQIRPKRKRTLAQKRQALGELKWSDWMSIAEAARSLGVVSRMIYHYIKVKHLPNGAGFERRSAMFGEGAYHTKHMVRYEMPKQDI